MNRRLFLALWPTDRTRAALVATSRAALRASGGRAVPAGHLHLTLAFLGAVPVRQMDRFEAWTPVALPEFELVLDHFGHWRGPRILWLGPRRCPAGLTALVVQIRAQLDTLGLPCDRRAFKPHVTLVRKVRTLPELEPPVPVSWPVRGFALVETVATSGGSVYEVRRRFPIASPSADPPAADPFCAGSRHEPKQD